MQELNQMMSVGTRYYSYIPICEVVVSDYNVILQIPVCIYFHLQICNVKKIWKVFLMNLFLRSLDFSEYDICMSGKKDSFKGPIIYLSVCKCWVSLNKSMIKGLKIQEVFC